MSKSKTIIAAVLAIAAMEVLTGCEQAPGDAEVREALRGRVVSLNESISRDWKMTDKESKELDKVLAKIKVVGCQKAYQKNGFNCDWTGAEPLAMVVGSSGRIVKSDSGWILTRAGE